MSKLEQKINEEIIRYKSINKYLFEQEVTLPPPPGDTGMTTPEIPAPGAEPMAATPPPAPAPEEPQPVDLKTDTEVEKIGNEKEEVEVTDLVKSQKNIEKKQDEYFDNLFKHLETLESKLGEMDNIMTKLNDLESKVEKYRVKTPQEKLELRTLDSGPFNQKLSQFFQDKEDDFEKSGKNEYILTQDEVEDYSPTEIKKTFRNFEDLEKTIDNFKQIR